MDKTIVILAAGLGSRYEGGIKQLAHVGRRGEIIMDFSIHDAIAAGFNRIVIILRHSILGDFKETIGKRIETLCTRLGVTVEYAFQELDTLPDGFTLPEGRKKPWGTGHALLCCKSLLDGPFAVINADDYYGKEAFIRMADFINESDPLRPYDLSFIGFVLKNTLSENGKVNRGICTVSDDGNLLTLNETRGIEKVGSQAFVNGVELDMESVVAMNMLTLTPEFMELLDRGFREFLSDSTRDHLTSEFVLPVYINELIRAGRVCVRMLKTGDKWFGVTYSSDTPMVKEEFSRLIDEGVYGERLFDDLFKYD